MIEPTRNDADRQAYWDWVLATFGVEYYMRVRYGLGDEEEEGDGAE